jgi:hypothetical protein
MAGPFDLRTNWQQYGVLQTDIWRFQADAGPLTVQLFSDWQPAIVRVVVTDEDRGTTLHDRYELVRGEPKLDLVLPHAGRYSLRIYDNRVAEVGVSATELRFPTVTPAISLPSMAAFDVKNAAFAVAPVVQNPTATAQVGIYQNGVKLFEGAPAVDGSIPPVMAESSSLPDGLFSLKVTGTAPGSGNQGVQVTPLLVDRTGSFTDVPPTQWARRYVEAMHDLGIVNGRPGGSYAPAASVTRAEFAKLLGAHRASAGGTRHPQPVRRRARGLGPALHRLGPGARLGQALGAGAGDHGPNQWLPGPRLSSERATAAG